MYKIYVPIVFCTFNRMEQTRKVFEKIQKVQPAKLYFVSDGARSHKKGEDVIVKNIREYVNKSINWECELINIFSEDNLGCAKRISTALDYVFEREDKAIILEDDCLPEDSFFGYCQEMLEEYKDDDRVMSIAGCPEIKYVPKRDIDYYFSSFFLCWGWATWKRAWKFYDFELSSFDKNKNHKIFKDILFVRNAYYNYMTQFKVLSKSEDKFSWAYQFSYASMLHNMLNIVPVKSQIQNMGFIDDSTHTNKMLEYYCGETEVYESNIRKNSEVVREIEFDSEYMLQTQKAGWIVKLKNIMGLDINKSIFN